jgi:hypothetical protein
MWNVTLRIQRSHAIRMATCSTFLSPPSKEITLSSLVVTNSLLVSHHFPVCESAVRLELINTSSAASAQGGNPSAGTSICIPGFQNSAQGQRLNQLNKRVGAKNDYIVEIGGWDCTPNRPKSTPTNCVGMIKRDESIDQTVTQGMAVDTSGILLYPKKKLTHNCRRLLL